MDAPKQGWTSPEREEAKNGERSITDNGSGEAPGRGLTGNSIALLGSAAVQLSRVSTPEYQERDGEECSPRF